MQRLLLSYLRLFPIDYGKQYITPYVKLPNKPILYSSPNGIKYRLDTKDHVMRQIYLRGVYERNTYRHLLRLCKPEFTCMDVGANIGAYTLAFADKLDSGKVISFEPNPTTLKFLNENIKLNGFKNITVNPFGVSDKNESATLYFPSLTTASINKHTESDVKVEIQLTSLDNYCEKNGIETIDMIKIDIEGHEFKCLEGARDLIKRCPKLIMSMEIDGNTNTVGQTRNGLFQYIRQMGFKGYIPRGFPFRMREIDYLDETHEDNIIFIKG